MLSHSDIAKYANKSYAQADYCFAEIEVAIFRRPRRGNFGGSQWCLPGTETSLVKEGGFVDVLRDLRIWTHFNHGMRGHAGS